MNAQLSYLLLGCCIGLETFVPSSGRLRLYGRCQPAAYNRCNVLSLQALPAASVQVVVPGRSGPKSLRAVIAAGASPFVALTDRACVNTSELVRRLQLSLESTGADVAIASPFVRGGKLFDLSWSSRTVAVWTNRFLSLAAHGEVSALAGVVRVLRRSTLKQALAQNPGLDDDSEVILECRRMRARIVEIPAVMLCDPSRSEAGFWAALNSQMKRTWNCLRSGLHYRPALWLAVPGLLPGLLPLVVAVLLVFKTGAALSAAVIAATLFIQYASLAVFSWQATGFIARLWKRRVAR